MRGKLLNREGEQLAYINEVLQVFLGRSVVAYIEDILIYSPSQDQHVHDIRAVLGTLLQNHLYCKLENTIAKPLTDLLRGLSKRIKWNPEAERSFTELKAAFSTAPVLQQPDPREPFVVEIDASNVGVSAVLSQHKGVARQLKPIACFSKKLSAAERNYGMGDR
ncbi:hypothetical protein P4O66_004742 [Electrophorus voltai]|uniref:Reverse transcriptase/retrotransposon-derived protein RNase H-like domain-containing protein n=1 Tax=Electrophorus voltai TaxID=2609070 RepID=A0AAD8ZMY1_9TELE|nr:hypothetical protein P4O66_004742 [Electrophorus voltai]